MSPLDVFSFRFDILLSYLIIYYSILQISVTSEIEKFSFVYSWWSTCNGGCIYMRQDSRLRPTVTTLWVNFNRYLTSPWAHFRRSCEAPWQEFGPVLSMIRQGAFEAVVKRKW